MANIVDTLDETLRLYGPAIERWMNRHQEFHGVRVFIGRDDPKALPTNEHGHGYGQDAFEAEAAAYLKPLVEATAALQAACPVTKGQHEPISVYAERNGEKFKVTVNISNRLGGLVAKRSAIASGDGSFWMTPANLFLTTMPDIGDAHVAGLKAAVEEGPKEAVRYLIDNDLILNLQGRDAKQAARWLKEFPKICDVSVSNPLVVAYSVGMMSAQTPVKIMATQAYLDANDGDHTLRNGKIPLLILDAPAPPAADLSAEDAETVDVATDAPAPK